MEFTKTIITLAIFSVLVSLSSPSANVVDFCVSDLSLPKTPSGYPCKNPANLTVDDFVYSGFRMAGNTSSVFNFTSVRATDNRFTALNGMGISMVRLDIGVGGAVPIHTHRVSEVILVIEGSIIACFIDSDNKAYYKTLNKYDIMIFPQSTLHFQVNVGDVPALAFVSLNSPQPGFMFTTPSLAANDIPTEIIERVTLLDGDQVRKLKAIFGGCGAQTK